MFQAHASCLGMKDVEVVGWAHPGSLALRATDPYTLCEVRYDLQLTFEASGTILAIDERSRILGPR